MVVSRCDVTLGDDVSKALAAAASSEASLPPVRGIVHAACPPQEGSGDDQQRFLEAKVWTFLVFVCEVYCRGAGTISNDSWRRTCGYFDILILLYSCMD